MMQIEPGEFQQEALLKQLEELQEEEKGNPANLGGQMSTAGDPAVDICCWLGFRDTITVNYITYNYFCRGKEWHVSISFNQEWSHIRPL